MQHDEPTLTGGWIRLLKRAGCLLLLALSLAGCSVNVADIRPATLVAPSPATPIATANKRAVPTITPPAAAPAWTDRHLTGHLIFLQFMRDNGELVKLDLASGQTMSLFQAPQSAWLLGAAVSPDGKQITLAYAPPPLDSSQPIGFTDLYLLPADGSGTPQVLLARGDPQESFSVPQWSADGRYIYYSHIIPDRTGPGSDIRFDFAIERVAYPNGQPEKILENAIWPRLSPDGKKLAYVSLNQQTGENNLYVANVDGTHAHAAVPAGTFFAVDAPLFSRDSQVLVFSAVGGPASSQRWSRQLISTVRPNVMKHNIPSDWWRVDLATGDIKSLTRIGDTGLYGDFSPDGRHIAFGAASGLYLMDDDGSNLTQIMNNGPVGTVSWAP